MTDAPGDVARDSRNQTSCSRCGGALAVDGHCPRCTTAHGTPDPEAATVVGTGSSTHHHEHRAEHDTDPAETLSGEGDDRRYAVQSALGHGGMGTVVSALDRDLQRTVAMKLIAGDADLPRRRRFVSEAHILGQLEHPNIIPIYGLGVHRRSNRLYFTMKQMEGHTLEFILDSLRAGDERPEWSLWRLLGVFVGICNGVGFAHMRGVIHRDLKPSNIMTGSFGQVMVMDWGLAKIVRTDAGIGTSDARHLAPEDGDDGATTRRQRRPTIGQLQNQGEQRGPETIDGEVLGTPQYMAPEQAAGRVDAIDERTDIYGLGAILYEILCLLPPIGSDSTERMLEAARSGRIPPPEERAPYRLIPPELSAIAMKALEKRPEDRYQNVRDLRADVHAFLAHRPVSVHADTLRSSLAKLMRRNPVAGATMLIAALILITVIAVAFVINVEARHEAEQRSRDLQAALVAHQTSEAGRKAAEAQASTLQERLRADSARPWVLSLDETFDAQWRDRWTATTGWMQDTALTDAQWQTWFTRDDRGLRLHNPIGNVGLSYRLPMPTELRVQLEATYLGGEDGGMHLVIGGDNWRQGYIFQVGGYRNSRAAILRSAAPHATGEIETLATTPFALRTGVPTTVTAVAAPEGDDLMLTLLVDGRPLLITHDPQPLSGPGRGSLALLANGPADTRWHRLRVWQRGEPLKPDLLATAQRHYERGNFVTARDLFREVTLSATDPGRRAQARATLADCERLAELSLQLPRWRERLETAWPEAHILLELEGSGLDLQVLGRIPDLEAVADLPLATVSLRDAADTDRPLDLTPLAGQDLIALRLKATPIDNLEPLRDAPLRQLSLAGVGRGHSLRPMAGAPLESLVLHGPFSDFAALAGAPIANLKLVRMPLSDLGWLADAPLRKVTLDLLPVTDLAAVAAPSLEALTLIQVACEDLSPLAATSLREFSLVGTPVSDLAAIKELPLRMLHLEQLHGIELGQIAATRITDLRLIDCPDVDLTAIAALPLRSLDLVGGAWSHLPQFERARLAEVRLSDCPIGELGALAGQPLIELQCVRTPIADASPVVGQRLVRASFQATALTSCAALAALPLDRLVIADSPVADLESLAGSAIRILGVDREQLAAIRRSGLIERMPQLRIIEILDPTGAVVERIAVEP